MLWAARSAWASAAGVILSSLASFTSPTANTSSRPSARSIRSTFTCPLAFSQSPCPARRSQSVLGVVPVAQKERSASITFPRASRYVPKSLPGDMNESSRTSTSWDSSQAWALRPARSLPVAWSSAGPEWASVTRASGRARRISALSSTPEGPPPTTRT